MVFVGIFKKSTPRPLTTIEEEKALDLLKSRQKS
jgi:hypothetical protein